MRKNVNSEISEYDPNKRQTSISYANVDIKHLYCRTKIKSIGKSEGARITVAQGIFQADCSREISETKAYENVTEFQSNL